MHHLWSFSLAILHLQHFTFTILNPVIIKMCSHPVQLCKEKQTDLQVTWRVVEQNDLQHQLLSSDNVGRQIQGQEERLERCELWEGHMETLYCLIRCKQHQQDNAHKVNERSIRGKLNNTETTINGDQKIRK